MTKEEIIKYINENGLCFVLDELVIEAKCNEASTINNCGIEEQVEFLLDYGISCKELEQQIKEHEDA